jgi:quercetin dioxygenase-like cupin family protein
MDRRFPGLASHMERDNPGMHTTDTIDFEYILSGEIVLELDDGAEVVLHPGDTVVQNGTRHRWHNRSSEPAVYVAFLVGAHRS